MTGQIAPHEHTEVRLVLSGSKPLATIEKVKDPIGYSIAIAMAGTGALKALTRPTTDSPEGEVVIVLPANKSLLVTYQELLEAGVANYGIKSYHRQMGKLFGYTALDIEMFIKSDIQCDCVKCNGMSTAPRADGLDNSAL